ncbi:tail fiber protein [Brevundimonas vitis]|uniref:Tail fiber protein n=1 Tax=Brevundimonas vitisensis TaxID=2800818 RepID=A0ABX7BNP2_9CAUL|nr:phage tail protein [Brevundimonas vitisensis]QQQ17744.1 tail fiber protein [Brevundimonas vitisensis]
MTALSLTVTQAGLAALVNAQATGASAAVIAQIGISATAFNVTTAVTAIPDEFKRVGAVSGQVVDAQTIHVAAVDASQDTYVVRSIGVYLNTGVLLAAYSQAEPLLEKTARSWAVFDAVIRLLSALAGNVAFSGGGWTNPPASEAIMGVIKLATGAEALAGVDATRAITPVTLALVAALKADRVRMITGGGLVAGGGDLSADRVLTVTEASDAEALAGVDGTKAITARRLATVKALKADKARTVTGGGLVTGGGDLSADRVLTVTEASDAEALAGVDATTVITPRRLAVAIAALIAGAPGALNTLDELAAALGDDANFAATVTNSLALKADKARTVTGGGLVTGGGDLSADRVLTVSEASEPQALAGEAADVVMTPRRVKALIDQTMAAARALIEDERRGDMVFRATQAVPAGAYECDGRALSRVGADAALFAVIGTAYGDGDGATTFNIPDMRGQFPRGWDHGRGLDPGRVFGSAQADEVKSHNHTIPSQNNGDAGNGYVEDANATGDVRATWTGFTGGDETRPTNLSGLWIIWR